MNCDLCTYRVRLPGYEDKLGMPISLTPHGDAPARGKRRARRSTSRPGAGSRTAPRAGLRPALSRRPRPVGPRPLQSAISATRIPDGTTALNDVSFSVAEGGRWRFSALTAPVRRRCCCTSTEMLEGGTGEIRIGEVVLDQSTRRGATQARVGDVLQDSDDQLFMPTVEADMRLAPGNLGLRGDALRARLDEALESVRLTDQAERAAASAVEPGSGAGLRSGVLAMHPGVLVLDEPPPPHLDPSARRELVDVLR